jgi:hypothetical protein
MSDDPRWGDDPRDRRADDGLDLGDDASLAVGRGQGSVRETITLKTNPRIAAMTREDSRATANRAIETRASILGTCACETSTCRADLTGRSSMMAGTASTACGARKPAPSRRSARFGSSRRATSATTTSARPIRDRATSATSAQEGLIRTERLDGHPDVAVVLTKEGRDVLESQYPVRFWRAIATRQRWLVEVSEDP